MPRSSIKRYFWVAAFVFLVPVVAGAQTVPTAPSNLHATSATSSAISLAWQDNSSSEDKVNIYRKLTTDTYWPTMYMTQIMGSNVTSYTDTTVTAGNTYDYAVEACLSGTGCQPERAYHIGVQAGTSGGGTCTNLSLAITSSQSSYATGEYVNYTWTCTSGASTSFRVGIQIQKPGGTTTSPFNEFYGTTLSMSYGFQIPPDYVTGSYSLQACLNQTSGVTCTQIASNASFNVTSSGGGSYAPPGGGVGNGTTPSAPGTLTATASASTVNLSWPEVSNATHYNLYRSVYPTSGAWASVCLGALSTTSCSDASVPSGAYQYRVEACASDYDCSGSVNSQWTYSSSVSVGSVTNATPPPAPGMPTGSATLLVGQTGSYTSTLYGSTGDQLQVVFDWGDSTYFGYSNVMAVSSAGTVSSAVSHSFAAAGTYQVRAKAKNSAGLESGWSGSLMVTVSGSTQNVPAAPSNLRKEAVAGTGLYLRWNDNAVNEDKFNVERKLTTASDWSGPLSVQLQGANITTYTDTTVTSGVTYDYRVQACLSGTGCSAYTYLNGVTVGTATATQEAVAITVKMRNGTIVPSGMVVFVRDGVATTAAFSVASSVVVYLLPGTYEMQPSFPGTVSSEVQLTGGAVTGRQLVVNASSGSTVEVSLPSRLTASVIVHNQADMPLSGAHVEAGNKDSAVYASADTDGSGVAWLQLPAGSYQALVTKAGYLARTVSLEVKDSSIEVVVTLEPLSITVSGRVLSGTNPVAEAAVRAVNASSQAVVIVNTNDKGEYRLALKAGTWHLYAVAEGFGVGDGGEVELSAAITARDIALGAARQLLLSSANIVPTVSVTVTAAELGVTVGLPANALGSGSSASVTIRESSYAMATDAAAPLPASVREVTAASSGAAITQLTNAATLEFGYTDGDLTALGVGADKASYLKLAFWNDSRHDWESLTSVVDTSNRKVRAATTHFTLFAIVLPFLASPAQAQTPVTPAEPTLATPTSGEPLDERAAQFAQVVAEGTKVYVSSPESLAQAVGKTRDSALEQRNLTNIVRKVVPQGTVSGVETAVTSFVTYGTVSTVHLGAGERAGVVGSFQSAYGRLPQSEYDWQEILKIANGRWPGTLLPERETAMTSTFQRVYLRAPNQRQTNDNAALSIMAYGLRSTKRNLGSEAASIAIFKGIFGHAPASSADWDTVRAIAYSGAKR